MPFPLTKVSVGSAVILSTAGGGFIAYRIVTRAENVTYGSKFREALIPVKGDESKDTWNKRLASLRTSTTKESSLVKEFKKVKDNVVGDDDWKTLQKTCGSVSTEEFSKTGAKLENFKSYCLLTIEEKLGNTIGRDVADSDGKWTSALNTLKAHRGGLNSEFFTLKNKSGATAKEVKDLCVGYYDNPFESSEDISVKSISSICTSR